ncbi:hypothetical protein AMECASPLE_036757 [Ameca splendens]|uniref:Transposase n=1 Tax=Ameca splendens TaxID=208324 RepID=A0ABV0XKU0_9TELE
MLNPYQREIYRVYPEFQRFLWKSWWRGSDLMICVQLIISLKPSSDPDLFPPDKVTLYMFLRLYSESVRIKMTFLWDIGIKTAAFYNCLLEIKHQEPNVKKSV